MGNGVLRLMGQRLARLVARLTGLAVAMGAGVVALATCLVLIGSGLGDIAQGVKVTPPKLGDITPPNELSIVFDRYGNEIGQFKSEENRKVVAFAAVPQHLIDAILAVEDANFYSHTGFNAKSTGRAMLENLSTGGVEQGGSTITQQLVKVSLLTREQKLDRKVREARLAVQLEKKMTKDEILEAYLNSVYFGGGAYGVESAARHYFGKSVGALITPESAFLAGMIRNPTGYDPVRFRDRSRNRRATVLARMAAVGNITVQEAEVLEKAPMPLPQSRVEEEMAGTYFVEQVKQDLLDDARLGDTPGERFQRVFNGGLRIYTTFDPKLQTAAEEVVADAIPQRSRDEFTASLVSVDVASGAIRAMVGGRGFETDKFNLVTQARRQPGSAWKPFTLVAALEAGYSPQSTISGLEPCPIPNPDGEPNPYLPSNYDGAEGSVSTLTDHLINSNNCAFARLNYIVGGAKVIGVAKRLGISTTLDNVPALSLGAEEVRPIDMVGAYAAIARDGKYIKPYFVDRIETTNGTLLLSADTQAKQVIRPDVARAVTQSMREVVRSGTATAAQLGRNRQVAGKTGTAQNYEDAWFVGFTAQVATAVWMGAPTGKIPMKNVGGVSVTGGSYPTEIWHDYMMVAMDDMAKLDFDTPGDNAFRKAECLQVERPKGAKAYSSVSSPEVKKAEAKKTTSKKATTKKATTKKTSEQAAAAPQVEIAGGFGRFGGFLVADSQIVGASQIFADSKSTKTTVKTTKKKKKSSVSNCDSWGGTGAAADTKSTKSTKTTKKSTAKSTSKVKTTSKAKAKTASKTPVEKPAIEQPKKSLAKKKAKPRATTPAAEPTPIPVEQQDPTPKSPLE